jgi:hypothetical protein
MPTRVVTRGLLLTLLTACAACSGGGLNPVTGKVTVKGEPAKGAVVIFHPKRDGFDAQRPSGVADETGAFKLMTGKKDGAPAGDYVVTITWPEEPAAKGKSKVISTDSNLPDIVDRLKGRYGDSSTSKLTATVKSGTNTIPTFELP